MLTFSVFTSHSVLAASEFAAGVCHKLQICTPLASVQCSIDGFRKTVDCSVIVGNVQYYH